MGSAHVPHAGFHDAPLLERIKVRSAGSRSPPTLPREDTQRTRTLSSFARHTLYDTWPIRR